MLAGELNFIGSGPAGMGSKGGVGVPDEHF